MRKIVSLAILAIAAFTFSGCSGDENDSESSIIATIGGERFTFDQFAVLHDTYTIDDIEYELITVGGISSTSVNEILFDVTKGITGTENVEHIRFKLDGEYYYGYTDGDFNVNITSNSPNGHRIVGTFSGNIHSENTNRTLIVTHGSLNIIVN
ncbi:hypothetical protein [Flavobacterium sp. 3HN19-14]|uniref:hypothetical protein n=1 Tax=Flavobacterium sp. 3HN19-14 TaxID=3448133 RepID=UPI003EE034F5